MELFGMSQLYKVGDKILCKGGDSVTAITKGRYYTIIYIENIYSKSIYIIDDKGYTDYYSTKLNTWYIGNYFYSKEEIRLMKLEKLNEVQCRR